MDSTRRTRSRLSEPVFFAALLASAGSPAAAFLATVIFAQLNVQIER